MYLKIDDNSHKSKGMLKVSIFGDRLKILLNEKKEKGDTHFQTMDSAANTLCVSRAQLYKYLKGESSPNITEIRFICDTLGCDTGYLLGEHDTKRLVNASVHVQTGLSEPAIEILRSENQQLCPRIDARVISELIENKELLTILCSCAVREYDTVPAFDYEPYETQRHDLLMLYDSLCDFIESYRQKHGLDVSIFDYAETVNRRRKKRP